MSNENPGRKLFTPEEATKFFGLDLIKYEDCCLWITSQLHPLGVFCPECSIQIIDERQTKFYKFEQIRCPDCKKKFTAATGTLLNGAKLEPREIYLLSVLSHLGVTATRIAGVLRCHVDTVHNWQAHFQAYQEIAGA